MSAFDPKRTSGSSGPRPFREPRPNRYYASADLGAHMKRREFIALVGGVTAMPLVAQAQQNERVRRIGVLMPFAKDSPEGQARIAAFLQEIQKLGWTEGRNLQIEYRWDAV